MSGTVAGVPVTCYLDHAGIGLVRPAVRAVMHEAIERVLAAGSAAYPHFFEARTLARTAAARLLGAEPDEVALVANTSTGLALVAGGLDWRSGDEVVVFERDFPANVAPWRHLAGRGVGLRFVTMRDGGYDLEDIEAALRPATRLIAASHVHFQTGFRFDLAALGALARSYQVPLCVDAAQSAGVAPLDLSAAGDGAGVDFLAAGGHKWLGAPPGTGVFFCRRERLESLAGAGLGWFGYTGSDEIFGQGGGRLRYDLPPRPAARRFEGAMLNFVGITGLAQALADLERVGPGAVWARVMALTATLRAALVQRGYEVAGRADPRTWSGIVAFRPPPPADPATLYSALAGAGCVCSYPDGWLRVSPHYWTSDGEVRRFLELV